MPELSKILIVEDEEAAANALKEYLENHGMEVFVAYNGEKGLELLESKKPHLVILDLRLGEGLSGLEVLRRAKALKGKAQIIVVSAINDVNVADLARGLGAVGYLTKPFVIEDLDRVILSRLENS